jgi:hypothetical protein
LENLIFLVFELHELLDESVAVFVTADLLRVLRVEHVIHDALRVGRRKRGQHFKHHVHAILIEHQPTHAPPALTIPIHASKQALETTD